MSGQTTFGFTQKPSNMLTSVELCAGAGGQALGLEAAGFDHECVAEIDADACKTLKLNRPEWNVWEGDIRQFDPSKFKGVDLVAGGLPCPPFSIAGKQLGEKDERNLFPAALDIPALGTPDPLPLHGLPSGRVHDAGGRDGGDDGRDAGR